MREYFFLQGNFYGGFNGCAESGEGKGGVECSRLMSNAAISVVSEVGVGARET